MPGTQANRPPLVGRAGELSVLAEVVRTLRRGGRLAVVEGEAGIGKTRVVEATVAAARAAGATVLAGRAEELEANRPFGAIADCFGVVERELDAPDAGPDAAGERQFRVAERVLDALDERCARGSVLVAVEDLHWADAGTLGVLARVAAGIERLPAALIVSARPQPRRRELERLLGLLAYRDATIVRLGPLDDAAMTELIERVLGARPGARLVRQARRAAGNPLFVCELVEAVRADGALVLGPGTAELATADVEPSLPLTILHRLSVLAPDVLELLGLASVLGSTFFATDLALLAGRPLSALVAPLQAARRAGVLDERGDRLAFRHELVRDALYDDMPLALRRGLHAQLAEALAAAGEPPERVAEHIARGARPGDERAVAALTRAARELAPRAPATALDLYDRAVALSAAPDAARGRLMPDVAEALVWAGRLADGEAACRAALAQALDGARAGRLRLHLVLLLSRRGRTAEAVREGEAGLAGDRAEPADRERLRGLVAVARVLEGDAARAEREAHGLLAASDDASARALATGALALAADARGEFAAAARLIAPVAAAAELSGARAAHDARPHMILGLALTHLDRLDEAQATIQTGRRWAEQLALADAVPIFHYQAALVHFLHGRLDDALAELAAHAQLAERTDIGWRLLAESVRALVAVHRDDLLAAERHVSAAEREAAAGAPSLGTDLMVVARARVLEAGGDAATALEAVAGTFTAAAPAFLPLLGPECARLAVATGRPERAAGVVAPLRRIAALNPGAAGLEAAALRAGGLLERDPAALLAAAASLHETGRALDGARALEEAAAAGAEHPRERLDQARGIYARCGAARDLARADAALRAAGGRHGVRGRRGRPASGWEALTETELRVVRLVAERLTNPEIAERMFISRRTVQTHVSHALAKLGVATRRELAAEAARRAGWRLRVEGVGEQAEQAEPAVEPLSRPAVDRDGA